MDVQFASMPACRRLSRGGSLFDRDGENLRFKSRAAAHFARLACHECANSITRELTLRLLIKPLHLRNESFKRSCDFLLAVAAKFHFNRLTVRAEIKRLFKFVRQIGKWHFFIDTEM